MFSSERKDVFVEEAECAEERKVRLWILKNEWYYKLLSAVPDISGGRQNSSSQALRMFIEQSHDEVHGCLKGHSGNSGGKILAIYMVEEAWLSEKKEV
ncbi:hypothetical protein Tco_0565510 [Tanacetum coccineum]